MEKWPLNQRETKSVLAHLCDGLVDRSFHQTGLDLLRLALSLGLLHLLVVVDDVSVRRRVVAVPAISLALVVKVQSRLEVLVWRNVVPRVLGADLPRTLTTDRRN